MVIRYTKNSFYREPPYDEEELAWLSKVLDKPPTAFSSRCFAPAKPEELQEVPRPNPKP